MLTEQRTPTSRYAAALRGPRPPRPSTLPIPLLARDVVERVLRDNPEYVRYCNGRLATSGLTDFLIATPAEPHRPDQIFSRLRWGGQFLFVSPSRREVLDLGRQIEAIGFRAELGPEFIRKPFLGMNLPFLGRKTHYLLARKTLLIPPGQDTQRFTYHVSIVPHTDPAHPLAVLKEVPTLESVCGRLQKRFPDVSPDVIEKRARKFTDKIFPTFLTREAGILLVLEEHLPAPYNRRVPKVIDIEKDERGFVRKLKMTWLRNGGKPLPHIEFCRQSADLLRVIHDIAGVIHLDLRLDNFVITEEGVGFVDFGSSVRQNEKIEENPLLCSLFDELMRTSQIQKMLENMTISGAVTSHAIKRGLQKVDKSVDFFYLAVQFNSPHSNPDLAPLIEFDPNSAEAKDLSKLTQEILRPHDPANPTFRSAKDILHGIERMQLKLDQPLPQP